MHDPAARGRASERCRAELQGAATRSPVMPLTVHRVTPDDCEAVAREVERWGYPRAITWLEECDGLWWSDTPRTGVFWLHRGFKRGDWILHAMRKPGEPGHPTDAVLAVIRATARTLGARRLYAPIDPAAADALAAHLFAHGFARGDGVLGAYLELED